MNKYKIFYVTSDGVKTWYRRDDDWVDDDTDAMEFSLDNAISVLIRLMKSLNETSMVKNEVLGFECI